MSDNIIASVSVATASAIIASQDDPYKILVADSAKHPKPVIPGGKVEREDTGGEFDRGLACILREVLEEVGTALEHPKLIGVATDPARDVRIVPYSKIKQAVIDPALWANTADTDQIKASYGCPDYIYAGSVSENAVQATEELKGHRFIDIRTLNVGDLSAGHDVIVLWYRQMLDEQGTQLSPGSMQNFEYDRQQLITMHRAEQKPAPEGSNLVA